MDASVYTVDEQIEDSSARRPHLVILGAGASVQACPNGDKSGNKLPVMSDLVETVGLSDDLDTAGVPWRGQNFEEIFGKMWTIQRCADTVRIVESKIRDYFRSLELPDAPTIYDYLILSLREKDVIATFNWDPFLWQAWERNHVKAAMPVILFLHGCAVLGHCREHKKLGPLDAGCPICRQRFTPTALLYPVPDKDYVTDPFIASQWKKFAAALESAFLITIFGYAAPDTDKAAVDMMQIAWGRSEDRSMEEVEIIDIRHEDEQVDTWRNFIHSHHYQVTGDYFDSLLAQHPRRTCEAMWQSLWEARSREYNPIKRADTLDDLSKWMGPLLAAEQRHR